MEATSVWVFAGVKEGKNLDGSWFAFWAHCQEQPLWSKWRKYSKRNRCCWLQDYGCRKTTFGMYHSVESWSWTRCKNTLLLDLISSEYHVRAKTWFLLCNFQWTFKFLIMYQGRKNDMTYYFLKYFQSNQIHIVIMVRLGIKVLLHLDNVLYTGFVLHNSLCMIVEN